MGFAGLNSASILVEYGCIVVVLGRLGSPFAVVRTAVLRDFLKRHN